MILFFTTEENYQQVQELAQELGHHGLILSPHEKNMRNLVEPYRNMIDLILVCHNTTEDDFTPNQKDIITTFLLAEISGDVKIIPICGRRSLYDFSSDCAQQFRPLYWHSTYDGGLSEEIKRIYEKFLDR